MDYKSQKDQEHQNDVSFMDKEYFIGLSVAMIKEIVEHAPFICRLEQKKLLARQSSQCRNQLCLNGCWI